MPRAKRKSDEVYNARRRARRLAQRIERDMARMTGAEREAAQSYLASVREQIAATYQDRRGPAYVQAERAAQAQAAAERLERQTQPVRATERRGQTRAAGRSNKLFERQVNLARLGKPSTIGPQAQAMVDIFYAATKRAWQGKDVNRRNEYILRALGETSLQAAFERVVNANWEALQTRALGYAATHEVDDTTDPEWAAAIEADMDQQGSSIWATMLDYTL